VRRTLADLFGCPWCFGTWAALVVVFFYFLTPYAWFAIAVLAVAGIGSLIQLAANLIGHSAELKKAQVVREKAEDTYTR
jgi:energy-converting hydrogenase Eha subunit G